MSERPLMGSRRARGASFVVLLVVRYITSKVVELKDSFKENFHLVVYIFIPTLILI